ncbi:MAG: serine hydrolase [Okeania sp. SIO3B5]|uniref:serine hydrolase n=1 Tax=Okeania sp. SIO3B5 TaxID=2607811 RepID=UPI0014005A22|nr:serine hydrolase [Okeania sp. SIO3B5]NEO54815.1 serine hydrolase [Okeania sp. SIO3B5]
MQHPNFKPNIYKKRLRHKRRRFKGVSLVLGSLIIGISGVLLVVNLLPSLKSSDRQVAGNQNSVCTQEDFLDLVQSSYLKYGYLKKSESHCFKFQVTANSSLKLNTSIKTILKAPNSTRDVVIHGERKQNLTQPGEYTIILSAQNSPTDYQLEVSLDNEMSLLTPSSNSTLPPGYSGQENSIYRPPLSSPDVPSTSVQFPTKLSYNVNRQPPFISYRNQELQAIVEEVIQEVEKRGFSSTDLSISLIDLSQDTCCLYAYYQDKMPRFPASISKLFWIVAYYAQEKKGVIAPGTIPEAHLEKMINKSDNQIASDVLDVITNTRSDKKLPDSEFNDWHNKRLSVNNFFKSAGYQNINLSQKNFPIPKFDLMSPQGFDLKMRQKPNKIERNYVTTYDVARLLYEIEYTKAVSPEHSQKIKSFMKRNLDRNYWENTEYNSVQGFFPELLPEDAQVFSKVGWYSGSRQDAAIIHSPDRTSNYILVIFGNNKKYAEDEKIFPDISRLVYDRMMDRGRRFPWFSHN